MPPRTAQVLSIALLVAAGMFLYVTRLGEGPVYLIHDETQGALQAHSIATTGRDLSGRFLPMYFTEPEFLPGRDPALIYVTALGLKVLPFSEAGVRTPTAIIGVVNVVLTFFVARRLFQSTTMGMVAAVMLLLTPIHFIRGRMVLSPFYTIPFILGWLWSLTRFDQQPSLKRLAAAAIWLGAGTYSYLAAVVMMPLYLAVTLVVGYRRLGMAAAAKAAAAFAATLVPMVLWYLTHPERNAQIVSSYQLDANAGSTLTRWVGLYWAFFDPSFLFVSGDTSLINSTRTAGFFPMAFTILLAIGLFGLVRSRKPVAIAIAFGFATAPLVSIISGAIEMNRVMFAIPAGVLAAVYGVHVMLRANVAARVAAIGLLVTIPWQFAGMYRTYFGDYKLHAASYFDGSVREAMRATMTRATAEGGEARIYVGSDIEWAHRTWRFYAIADDRRAMIDRVVFVDRRPADGPEDAWMLCGAGSAWCRQDAGWESVDTVTSIDGARSFAILRRASAKRAAER